MPGPLSMLALLPLVAPAFGASVELRGDHWEVLTDRAAPPDPDKPPGPVVVAREVELRRQDDAVLVRGRWTVRAERPGWLSGTLVGGDAEVVRATWNGRPAPLLATPDGARIAGWVAGDVEITLVAEVPFSEEADALALTLLPAVRGTVEVATGDGPLSVGAIEGGGPVVAVDGTSWSSAPLLSLDLRVPAPDRADRTLVVGRSAVGLTVGDAEIAGRARLSWVVRQGRVDAVSFRLPGVGGDLDITGPLVRGWHRTGDRIAVELHAPATERVDLDVSWSAPVSAATESSAGVPVPALEGALRTESALQLARAGDLEVVPALSGWHPVAPSELPEWARGLITGTPTAAYQASGTPSGTLGLLRFEPVEVPPVVVDVASVQIATTEEGRLIGRAHYEVRNERASHLRVIPPAGVRLIGVRVGGETALPVIDDGPGWLLPLPRSVETVEGALSFPVEVALLGEEVAWDRRVDRRLALPVVDAPVAVTRVTVYLPPGYDDRLGDGGRDRVAAFTEGQGITYGFGSGDVGAVVADEVFQRAVTAWMGNEFDEAQYALDELREMGASSENIVRLQSNLDVVAGTYGGESNVAAQRRVKEQARARAQDEEQTVRESAREAEEAYRAGDYDKAKKLYSEAKDTAEKLGKLEQSESVEFSSASSAFEQRIVEIDEQAIEIPARSFESEVVSARHDILDVRGEMPWTVDAESPFEGADEDGEPLELWGQVLREGDDDGVAIEGHGYGGSVIGGSAGAALGGVAVPEPETTTEHEPPPVTVDRDSKESVMMERRRGVRISLPGIGGRKSKRAPSPDEVGRDTALPQPDVHASALSVTIPAAGEAVLYQRMLLPAGAAFEVVLEARGPRRRNPR